MIKKVWYIPLIICEIILIAIFLLESSRVNFYMILNMQLVFIVIRKAKNIKDNFFYGAMWIRRTIYFIPYILPLIFFSPKVLNESNLLLNIFISIIVGICLILFNINGIKNLYNKDIMLLFPPITFNDLSIELYSSIGSAILQEFFYRVFLISSIYHIVGGVLAILISAILFVAEHMMHSILNNSFTIKDYIGQFIMSTLSGILFIKSGAIIVPMLIHIIFNGAISISYILRFYWTKRSVERGE
ncbi:CPBP family intramembrane metalloprotease [Clostridium beijerinckii]|uniref:CPBP family intramembrane glutamic endopeptidase n=1 Tax=Clostridium beijerinckii TaxID=1520 RepID=UPI001494D423|nr:CPBP family intramembrane glutamic endopeptidase [Clostridium beijerinckii]NOW07501.1 membrane protease YdiL (CAAX protease family) [Clostridium beijerinckii]NYC04726.1 membrane protease YdiL (CAAX protease family) [Clostridium beijerinckii]UYZ35671.1 CPBP family intramembrane metalloprotease [Clostridium beijerinckii]